MHARVFLAFVAMVALLLTLWQRIEGYAKKKRKQKGRRRKRTASKPKKKVDKRRFKFPGVATVRLQYTSARNLSKREKKVAVAGRTNGMERYGEDDGSDPSTTQESQQSTAAQFQDSQQVSMTVADVVGSQTSSILTLFNPGVYDQGAMGNCVVNALCMAWRFAFWHVSGGTDLNISRLHLYHDARVLECGTDCDLSAKIGALAGDVITSLQQNGFVEDSMWPQTSITDDETSAYTQTPPPGVPEAALSNRNRYIASYYDNASRQVQSALVVEMVQSVNGVKQCIQEGYPVVFSICTTLELPELRDDGLITPAAFDVATGGHCMMIVGYNDAAQYFIVQNSWSSDWGVNGLGIMKYDDWVNVLDMIGWRIHLYG